jgi:hypothetical protein
MDGGNKAIAAPMHGFDELRRSPRMYRSTLTQAQTLAQDQGKFIFKGVPPGSWKLFAFDEVEPNAWLDPDFLKSVEALGESVSVAEGEQRRWSSDEEAASCARGSDREGQFRRHAGRGLCAMPATSSTSSQLDGRRLG